MRISEQDKDFFLANLRRVLYNTQIQKCNIEWLKLSLACPSELKVRLNNAINANQRMIDAILSLSKKAETRVGVMGELKDDQIKDLNLLFDEVYKVDDLTGIIDGIKKAKQGLAA